MDSLTGQSDSRTRVDSYIVPVELEQAKILADVAHVNWWEEEKFRFSLSGTGLGSAPLCACWIRVFIFNSNASG